MTVIWYKRDMNQQATDPNESLNRIHKKSFGNYSGSYFDFFINAFNVGTFTSFKALM
jgi:hypothetical protein